MSEQVLTILKLCLLALLYLFFFRVLRAVWAEIGAARPARRADRAVAVAGPPAGPAPAPVPAPPRPNRKAKGPPTELVVVEPTDRRGTRFTVGDELTVGRAAGCQITIEDTYVSSLHARVFRRDGQLMVEDLGSTNGTYLNRAKVGAAIAMAKGDRLQFGNTILEAA